MGELRRGADHMEAPPRGTSSRFRPFIPEIKWKDDKEEKYVLFLNSLDEVPTVDYHDWIPVGRGTKADGEEYIKYDQFIARTDPWIGEEYDDLASRLTKTPKRRSVGVVVELEPTYKTVKGRERPVGFKVATRDYERKTEDGNSETITMPLIGLVVQADPNFWSWLRSYNEREAPIEDVPFNVVRDGKDSNTTYNFIPAEGKPVDLSNLIKHIDGVSYLEDHVEDLHKDIKGKKEEAAARIIGNTLLDVRLAELADGERYTELVDDILEIRDPFTGTGENRFRSDATPAPAASNGAGRGDKFDRLKASLEE